jgi:hypothetical protein
MDYGVRSGEKVMTQKGRNEDEKLDVYPTLGAYRLLYRAVVFRTLNLSKVIIS